MRYKSIYVENVEVDIDPREIIAFVINENSGKVQGYLTEQAKLYSYFVSPAVRGLRIEEYGFSAWFKTHKEASDFIEKEKAWDVK